MTEQTCPTCAECAEYATKRLPTVMRLWHDETGRKTNVRAFMSGVHDRHLTGLPILAVSK